MTPLPAAELVGLPPAFQVAADYLARYAGRTREAYTLDLRTFFSWCAVTAIRTPSC